jgi:hypothetical protein
VFCRKALPFNKGLLVLVVYLLFDPGLDAGDVLVKLNGETVRLEAAFARRARNRLDLFQARHLLLGGERLQGAEASAKPDGDVGQVSRTVLDQLVMLPPAPIFVRAAFPVPLRRFSAVSVASASRHAFARPPVFTVLVSALSRRPSFLHFSCSR